MDIKTAISNFFDAENARNWDEYRKYIAPDVRWELSTGRNSKTITGATDYMAYIQAAYENANTTFECEQLFCEGNRIVAILKNTEHKYSCDIFDFEDGLIVREYEFILD